MRRLADENRMACPVGIIAVMRDMIDEQQRFARLGIVQLHAARIGRLPVGDHSDCPMAFQFLVAEAEKVGELRRLKAGNAVGHADDLRPMRGERFSKLLCPIRRMVQIHLLEL